MVEEPSVEETVEILRGLRAAYETHHDVEIDDEALEAAARLSDRYVTEYRLPDKAIDLVDQAAARVKVRGDSPAAARAGGSAAPPPPRRGCASAWTRCAPRSRPRSTPRHTRTPGRSRPRSTRW